MDMNARFGFRSSPFTREIAIAELFPHPQRAAVVDALARTVEDRTSGTLVGPAGVGKTVALRELRDRLPEVRYAVRYVKVTDLSKRDMCREIAASLGLTPVGTYPGLVRAVQVAVERRIADDGIRTVLILDEAHDMRPDVLGMLRILTNFEMDSRLVLSVVLVGQPPLAQLLRRPELEDLAQRIAWYGSLRPLTRDELHAYLVPAAGSPAVPPRSSTSGRWRPCSRWGRATLARRTTSPVVPWRRRTRPVSIGSARAM